MAALTHFSQLMKFMNKHEVYYNINISLKNSYIYFETAKAACTTIKRTLMNLELENTSYRPKKVHLDVFCTPFVKIYQLEFAKVIKLFIAEDMFKFCFVRNPYARVLSCYLDKIAGNKPQKKKILKVLGSNENEIEKRIEFEEFIDAIGLQKPKEMDQHWRTQYFQLFGGLIRFDHIGKVENFHNDLKIVDSRLGGNILRHHEDVLWHQTHTKTKMSDYYDDRIAEKVMKIYAIDFEKFGYSKIWREA